jgi:hypothetical protein
MNDQLGPIALLGSGETSLAGGRVFETIAQKLPRPIRIAILETPAGFELNSSQVAEKVGAFMKTRLQNYNPEIDIIPARRRGTIFGTDEPEILKPLARADLIFMGPGSPTYAVRQLTGSLAWDLIKARHRRGAALVFASAATISVGAWALPVYEIYKVGQDVHALPGLELFADFGFRISCIPHWNNTDGGADVDTSRCFVGIDRFAQWCDSLPVGNTTIGLDEHTGLIIDFAAGKCSVSGVSSVTLLRECDPRIYPAGATFSLAELGDLQISDESRIRPEAWEMLENAALEPGLDTVPDEVLQLAEKRQFARSQKEWAKSDEIRKQIASLGWLVQDSPEGPKLIRL